MPHSVGAHSGSPQRRVTSRATQTEPLTQCGGPVETLSSSPPHVTACALWCLAAEVTCALNGVSAFVYWRRIVSLHSGTDSRTFPFSSSSSLSSSLVASYHALLGGCFFHLVGCQTAVQLAVRQVVSTARTDGRPASVGCRSAHTSAWPATLWYVLTIIPVVVPQFKLVHDVWDRASLLSAPAFPVFVIALVLSMVLAVCTLSATWSNWVVDALQRAVRHVAVSGRIHASPAPTTAT